MERITTLIVHDLTERELLVLRQEVESRKKSVAAAWLLWLFLGFFGAHRFFLGRIGTGIAMLLLCWLTLGIWWIVDAFLIPGMLRANQKKVQDEVLGEIAAMREREAKKQ
jgi:TM2 domain-containing membrane protein YozV